MLCFYCNKREQDDELKACESCAAWMDRGIILISYSPNMTTDPKAPYRTGGWRVVSDMYIRRLLMGQVLIDVLYARCTFIDDEAWIRLGLNSPQWESNRKAARN